ncbi:unnamed protein product, partial [Ceratitis capitata]
MRRSRRRGRGETLTNPIHQTSSTPLHSNMNCYRLLNVLATKCRGIYSYDIASTNNKKHTQNPGDKSSYTNAWLPKVFEFRIKELARPQILRLRRRATTIHHSDFRQPAGCRLAASRWLLTVGTFADGRLVVWSVEWLVAGYVNSPAASGQQ